MSRALFVRDSFLLVTVFPLFYFPFSRCDVKLSALRYFYFSFLLPFLISLSGCLKLCSWEFILSLLINPKLLALRKLWDLFFSTGLSTIPVAYWPSTRSNMPFQSDALEGSDTFQWPVIERNRVGEFWLTKWDMIKAHDTLIDWCTGREWAVNYMTVISAWWRSNMPFQRLRGRLSGRLNYYITRWRQEVRE